MRSICVAAGWCLLACLVRADEGPWWAFAPLQAAAYDSVDDFVGERLRAVGQEINPPADRRTLIRRATYDLHGLPPTPEEVDRFVRDPDPAAFAKLVDRLLDSPRYGERWGRHWLDVVRFGESNGFERNVIIDTLWPFRDWVIDSINADKPFDQFIREHLAGDVIAPGDPGVAVGSAFLVAGPYDNVGNQDKVAAAQIRADTIDEMIRASSEAFLGITVGCARCHDHKFDPIPAADYYALYASFAGVQHGDAPFPGQPDGKRKLWMGSRHPANGPFHVFVGGDPQKRGGEVLPSSLTYAGGEATRYSLAADSPESERRLRLAQWITDDGNALTARVLANRVWQHHFGTGIVDTPNDFGKMGGEPSHPELLDWLALRLKAGGWRLKSLHREIMLSSAYRQSSSSDPGALGIDGDSRLLWRFPPRRLSAEEVRDTMLMVAGKLVTEPSGGPGFRLYDYQQDNVATYVPLDAHGPETYRRAVYHQNARASVVDLMSDFDQPDCAFSAPRRANTTTPLQALTMLNHAFTVDMAEALARRVEWLGGDAPVETVFSLAFQRAPDPAERDAGRAAVAEGGLRALCRAVLNSSELIYLD